MKKLLSLLIVACSLQLTLANSKNIPSEIKTVTVFQQGAQISRSANVLVPEGTTTLVFHGLAQSMDPNSIILSGTGSVTVLSITHKIDYLTEDDKSVSMAKLEEEMKKLDMRLYELEAERHGLVMEREVLEANRDIGGTQGVSSEELRKAAQITKEIRERNALDWYKTETEKNELTKRKQALQNQFNQERMVFAQKTGQVEVRVEAKSAVNATFHLSYIVMGASWKSSYDVRVDYLTKPVQLSHKAQIMQQTGEDWTHVDLKLATGNPSAGAQVPYMGVWYVNYNNVGRPEQLSEVQMSNANTRFKKSEATAMDDVIANQQFAVSQNLTQQEYTIERKQTIASTNSPITVVLRELELDAKYEYHAKPRLDPDAFLVAKVYNWGQFDLLDGELSLFNNNTYVGKAFLNTQNPDDTLQLSLGRDKGLVVKRSRVYNKQEKTLFGSNKIDYFVWKIEVRNNKKVPVDIVLRDQVPVSQHEDIKVTVNNVGGGDYDEKTGIIKWRLKQLPGAKNIYEITYEVKYPKNVGTGVMYY